MASIAWTKQLLSPAPIAARPRWIHWLAWGAAIASLTVMAMAMSQPAAAAPSWLAPTDLGLSVALALEFLTRSGFRQERWTYLRWRWFDFVALVPVVFLSTVAPTPVFVVGVVLAARVWRVIDRTLGDGFVKRHLLALVGAIEEEISDRVLDKILQRVESELKKARFGDAAGTALGRRKDAFLSRIYEEQKPEGAAAARLLGVTGIQSAVERLEERIFDAVVKVVKSHETDALIAEVLSASLGEAREEIGRRSWRANLGVRSPDKA